MIIVTLKRENLFMFESTANQKKREKMGSQKIFHVAYVVTHMIQSPTKK